MLLLATPYVRVCLYAMKWCVKLLRRFIPKGTPIKAVSEETIQRALKWCNNLPRKLLDYQTPQEVFIEEVNKVMDLQSVQFNIAI